MLVQNLDLQVFEQFDNRITFSRMIGKYGIPLDVFNNFLKKASSYLNVRTGGYDCTMYGGLCGAYMNNIFYANGNVYICGNCIDMKPLGTSDMPLSYFENYYEKFIQAGDLSAILEEYNDRLVNRNAQVRVLDPKGEFSGTALGINKSGELLVKKEDGSVAEVYAGEVSVRGIYGYV